VRTDFQLPFKLFIALSTPNRFHVKRLTRLIYSRHMDFFRVLTAINTSEADSMRPVRHALCC
jgi:hypothetical protein